MTRGMFCNIQTFYASDDTIHYRLFEAHGLADLMYETGFLALMRQVGFSAQVMLERDSVLLPSPRSELLPDWRIDGVPLSETHGTVSVVVDQ